MDTLQQDILRRHGLVALGGFLFTTLLFVGYYQQESISHPWALLGIGVLYWACHLGLLRWIALGRSSTYKDPSLTFVFMLVGMTAISASLYVVPANKDIAILIYLAMIPYGIFQLRLRQFVFIALYSTGSYFFVRYLHYTEQIVPFDWMREILVLTMFLLSLLSYAVLGKEVTILRAAYWKKNRELRQAILRINELAVTDELTGLYNRRYLIEMLEKQRAIVLRDESYFSVAFIDIDQFKAINDRYGHAVGDQVLTELSRILRDSVRTIDIAARYGGEEFVLLLNGLRMEDAQNVVQRLRVQLMHERFSQHKLCLTISAGVTEYQMPEAIDDLLVRADNFLYEAKHTGRNKVIAGLAPTPLMLEEALQELEPQSS